MTNRRLIKYVVALERARESHLNGELSDKDCGGSYDSKLANISYITRAATRSDSFYLSQLSNNRFGLYTSIGLSIGVLFSASSLKQEHYIDSIYRILAFAFLGGIIQQGVELVRHANISAIRAKRTERIRERCLASKFI